jgi:hypothetical protein
MERRPYGKNIRRCQLIRSYELTILFSSTLILPSLNPFSVYWRGELAKETYRTGEH